MTLPRILFVDDDPGVLSGLRDVLRRDRRRWDMGFVGTVAEALAELERSPCAVLVTDLRMPGADGVELLEHVHARHPEVARLALSGHADQGAMLRSLALVQQFLLKPCPPEMLRGAIERVLHLHAVLRVEALQRAVGRLDRLPAEPTAYMALTRALERPGTSADELAAVVEQDPAMAVRILQTVNSAWFGPARPVASLREAVVRLGVDLLRGLALTSDVFGAVDPGRLGPLSLHTLQRHSFASASLARRIVGSGAAAEVAFAAAVVRDVGRLVLALDDEGLAARLRERMEAPGGVLLDAAERALLGIDHAAVAGSLLQSWTLPLPLVEAVTFHHAPSRAPDAADRTILGAVHVADALMPSACAGEPERPEEARLDRDFVAAAGLAAELPRLRRLAREEQERAEQSGS